jgi:hypothetical protein
MGSLVRAQEGEPIQKRGQKRPLFCFYNPPVSFKWTFLTAASFLEVTTQEKDRAAAEKFN